LLLAGAGPDDRDGFREGRWLRDILTAERHSTRSIAGGCLMQRSIVASVLVLLAAVPLFAQGPAAKVSDLAWMTGHYAGKTGNGTLEETWAEPLGGSIAALVRSTGAGGATNMIELIVIEEVGNSLILRLKQWDPGMKERAAGFQVMELIEIADRKVVFKNTGREGLQQLGYSLKGDQFTISVKTAQGAFDIPLTRRSGH
jgi:hypothetical protein